MNEHHDLMTAEEFSEHADYFQDLAQQLGDILEEHEFTLDSDERDVLDEVGDALRDQARVYQGIAADELSPWSNQLHAGLRLCAALDRARNKAENHTPRKTTQERN